MKAPLRLPALSLLVSADRMFYETKNPYSAPEINDFLWIEGRGVVMETTSSNDANKLTPKRVVVLNVKINLEPVLMH